MVGESKKDGEEKVGEKSSSPSAPEHRMSMFGGWDGEEDLINLDVLSLRPF